MRTTEDMQKQISQVWSQMGGPQMQTQLTQAFDKAVDEETKAEFIRRCSQVNNTISQQAVKVGDTIHSGAENMELHALNTFQDAYKVVIEASVMPEPNSSLDPIPTVHNKTEEGRDAAESNATESRTTVTERESNSREMTEARPVELLSEGMNIFTEPDEKEGEGAELWIGDPEGNHTSSVSVSTKEIVQPQKETLNLKLLRGKDLPAEESARLKIYLNESEVIADIAMEEAQPAWGGPHFTYTFEAYTSFDELMFEWHAYGFSGKVIAPVLQLLATDNLQQENAKINHWIKIAMGGDGQIQLRLTPTIDEAPRLRPAETCAVLLAGPSLPQNLQSSDAARNQILFGKGSPVILNVYDVSNSPSVAQLNESLKYLGEGGIYHAAIEIQGMEYSFGGTRDVEYEGTGIFSNHPKACTMHRYRKSVYLGDCDLNETQVGILIKQLESDWKANSYNMFRRNSCFFCHSLAQELGVGGLPKWVFSFTERVEGVEPTLSKVNQYAMDRQRTLKRSHVSKC